jgi:hypothetical protein
MSTMPWLDDEELRDLTGYVRPTCQARWLGENGIKFYLNAINKVRVPREAVAGLQVGKTQKRTEPDFSKVRKAS